ncbi:small ribosomal subunit protein uS7-like [Gorilla gorilla gorilla]|uniref:small ribosomal subunit protein uS7-like n=1 Tax=Gorilla gorilla gorilla TaxID=9595 RepID=UPI002445D1BB|nr:40S ribosomal protein S5-like [Gorilla gorilla gorilla]
MTAWETAAPAVAETPDIKLFGKWSTDDVHISDISLQDYIAVKEKYAKYLPHSAGWYAAKCFRKAQCPIVERLTNSMMMHGCNNGKKLMTVCIVKHAFEVIHLLTGENPLQVLVNAIINSGPREDSTRIGCARTVRRQAVDVSPLRRVNQAMWLLCTGAREAAFRNIKTIAECLAEELINAAKGSSNSYAIKKDVWPSWSMWPSPATDFPSCCPINLSALQGSPTKKTKKLQLSYYNDFKNVHVDIQYEFQERKREL